MIKRFLIKWLFKLLDSSNPSEYNKIDKEATEKWLFESYGNEGFKSYFKYEDLKILKAALSGQDRDSYMILIGRRFQLLYMLNDARKVFENRKSKEDKSKVVVK